jgi:hypothetical protein
MFIKYIYIMENQEARQELNNRLMQAQKQRMTQGINSGTNLDNNVITGQGLSGGNFCNNCNCNNCNRNKGGFISPTPNELDYHHNQLANALHKAYTEQYEQLNKNTR